MSTISDKKAIILFDGVCNFCNSYINFVIDNDPLDYFRFATIQSPIGQETLSRLGMYNAQNLDSVVLIDGDKILIKSDAILNIADKLDIFWMKPFALFAKIIPKTTRNFFYDKFAKNRYKLFGINSTCRMPTPSFKKRFL